MFWLRYSRWAWIVASLKPKLFCGVALYGEKSCTSREHARGRPTQRLVAPRTIYATIIVNGHLPLWPSNASTPTEPIGRCLLFRPPCPKRQTIRTQRVCVKRGGYIRMLEEPLKQVPDAETNGADEPNHEQAQQRHHELKFAIPILVGRC